MPQRLTAEERLSRLLQLLPRAARDGGATLAELSAELDVPARELLADLGEVTSRAYYHPAGSAEDLQITIEPDRVQVWSGSGEFLRPARLSPREAMVLAIGLRILAADAGPARRDDLLRLAADLERQLGAVPPEALASGAASPRGEGTPARPATTADARGSGAIEAGEEDEAGIRALVLGAARERVRCRIRYLKPAAAEPDERTVDPYAVVHAGGRWYAISHCHASAGIRAFRLDRILAAEPTDEGFEVPEGFDPAAYLTGGDVYRAESEVEARVRYSPRIARWLAERGEGEVGADGSVVVTRRVADPRWVVRHVLRYGADAELLEPPTLRQLLLDSLRGAHPVV